jgi:hypothetical protein
VSLQRQAPAWRGAAACLAVVLTGVWLAAAAAVGAAAEYQFNPRLEIGGGYDDNANLAVASGSKIGAADALGDARVAFVARESNWQWRLTPEVRGTWYPSHSSLDSNGEFLYLDGQRTGARYALALDGFGSSQSLLPTSLPTANIGTGLGVSEPGTTLVVPTSIRQNLGYLSPNYTFEMTERRSLELNATYTDATYSHEFAGSYVNYQNITGSAGLVLRLTPTGSLTLRATAADFRPDLGNRTDTYGGEIQWDGTLSATKQYYLRIGGGHTDFSGMMASSGTSGSANWSAGAGTHWTYTLTEIFLDATRNVAPTAQGYADNQNQLRLRIARRFTPRLAGFLGVRTIYEEPVPGTVGQNLRSQHYNYATTGLEWRIERGFSFIGAYDYTDYHFGGPSSSGRANSVRVSVVYEPHRPAEGPAITVGY